MAAVAAAGEDSMTQQVAASFVMGDLSIWQHEQDQGGLQLSAVVLVVSGDMLLAVMLQ